MQVELVSQKGPQRPPAGSNQNVNQYTMHYGQPSFDGSSSVGQGQNASPLFGPTSTSSAYDRLGILGIERAPSHKYGAGGKNAYDAPGEKVRAENTVGRIVHYNIDEALSNSLEALNLQTFDGYEFDRSYSTGTPNPSFGTPGAGSAQPRSGDVTAAPSQVPSPPQHGHAAASAALTKA